MKLVRIATLGLAVALSAVPARSTAQLSGPQNFIVLRVQFSDMVGTTYGNAEIQKWFTNFIPTSWGNDSSYGVMQQKFQVSSIIGLNNTTAYYLDLVDHSSPTKFTSLYQDAVAKAPSGLQWQNLRGLVIMISDTRPNGFHRGWTIPGQQVNAPGIGQIYIPVSEVSEDPVEDETSAWGRVAHEIGHAMQQGAPPHPSNYNSDFEQMDGEYPAQTGVFEKQPNTGFPGWLPPAKYVLVSPTTNNGIERAIWAEENPPGGEPDAQAVKAFLKFGGTSVYYLISVRRRTLGDDANTATSSVSPTDCDTVATPLGIPDCGVLIERVVEGGDPNIVDAKVPRWVDVLGNAKYANSDHLWHVGDVYSSATYNNNTVKNDGIVIGVRQRPDRDHYVVFVSYDGNAANQPDVGLQSWLQPPGNTYETTDIWFDSPLNGYAPAPPGNDTNPLNYRYGTQSDLLGGVVPIGNGDDPAVGQDNRFYARIRNYGTQPATNVKVFFDVTNPPGLGVQGSNGFKNIGSVGTAQFPSLASIAPGAHVDVYLDWTPNFPLTQQQIADGQFAFHTCVRVRVSHVPGETFFANQDGDGQQENILYFDATGAGGAPGAPGMAQQAKIHLKNDSPGTPKTLILGILTDSLPPGWAVTINNGHPVVTLPPGGTATVPFSIKQNRAEAIGAAHTLRIIAMQSITFTDPHRPAPRNKHDEAHRFGGVQVHVAVLRKTKIVCNSSNGTVHGSISGLDSRDFVNKNGSRVSAFVALLNQVTPTVTFDRRRHVLASVARDGTFATQAPSHGPGVCLYAGSQYSSSAGSTVVAM